MGMEILVWVWRFIMSIFSDYKFQLRFQVFLPFLLTAFFIPSTSEFLVLQVHFLPFQVAKAWQYDVLQLTSELQRRPGMGRCSGSTVSRNPRQKIPQWNNRVFRQGSQCWSFKSVFSHSKYYKLGSMTCYNYPLSCKDVRARVGVLV